MTLLTHWTQTPAAHALGWTLFHFLWEGLAIAAALAIALLLLRPAPLRYAASCLALAAMLLACAATFIRVFPDQAPAIRAIPVRLSPAPAGILPAAPPRPFRAEDVLPWTAPVWLLGVVLLHTRTMAAWLGVRRLRRSAAPVPQPWHNRLARLADAVRLSTPVALLETCRVEAPVVVGYLRPAILLPLGFLTGMSADHVEAILLHELAHIRRRDYLVNLLQTVAENLLFYHPAVWWISNLIRTEREHCCDDLVVAVHGDAHRYAVALTALETRRITGEPALAATGGDLMKRIHRLLDRPEPPHAALSPALSAGLILLTAAVALTAWQPAPQEQRLASPYEKWVKEDVAYIIDDRERATFQALTTDEEREHFIEQFWERRDPTPGTPANEFKEEHYRRIAYSNDKFSDSTGLPGWKTDRGRIYIIYGPPDEIESHPAANPPNHQWLYRHIEGVGNNVIVEFSDEARDGRYRMTSDPRARPPKPAALVKPAPIAPAASYWQVAAVTDRDADVIRRTLVGKGFPTSLSVTPSGLARVLVGPYTDDAAARKAKAELESLGFHPVSLAAARVDAAKDAAVSRDAIWADAVQRGDMSRRAVMFGTMAENGLIALKPLDDTAKELRPGLAASVFIHGTHASGRIARSGDDPAIQLDAPAAVQTGVLRALVTLPPLRNVLHVGRPAGAQPHSVGVLFRLNPDGRSASQTAVRYGRISDDRIEIVDGLAAGDRVILSDMSAYARFPRIDIR